MENEKILTKTRFCEMRRDNYCETLENYNVSFKSNSLACSEGKKIIHVPAEGRNLLQIIRIYRALRRNQCHILYVSPEDGAEKLKQAIEVFGQSLYTYLVIVWPQVAEESVAAEMCEELREIMDINENKKVVVIAENDNALVQQLQSNMNSFHIMSEDVTFKDLSKDTQEELLKKKNIIFQGENMSMEELFDPQEYEAVLRPEILQKLIKNEMIIVASKLQPLDEYLDHHYISRTLCRGAEVIEETDIYDMDEKCISIMAGAGLGKSALLSNLATNIKKKHPNLWVVLINLGDCTRILRNLKRENRKVIDVVELLGSDMITSGNHLESFIFSMSKKVVLLLDGVDEVYPDYAELITSLLATCRDGHNFAKIIISGRPHVSRALEDTLLVKSLEFKPFMQQTGVDLLTAYWARNLKLSDMEKVKCGKYAEELINKLCHNDCFIKGPLELRILAENFQEDTSLERATDWHTCKDFLSGDEQVPKLPQRATLRAYEILIEKRRGVFMEKGNPTGNLVANQGLTYLYEKCIDCYQNLALRSILDEEMLQFFSAYNTVGKDMEIHILNIGIIQKLGNSFYFIHRVVGEYFVGQGLLRELTTQNPNVEFQRFFLTQILIDPKFSIVRAFLNSSLMKVLHTLPSDSLGVYQSSTSEVNDTKNWNLIHILAREGCISILQLLFKCMNFKIVRDKQISLVEIQKKFSGGKFGNALQNLQFMLQQGGVNIHDDKMNTPLHEAAKEGHLETVQFLVEQGANIDSLNNQKETALYKAVEFGYLDVVKYFISIGACINFTNSSKEDLLNYSVRYNKMNIATYLLDHFLETNRTDYSIPYAAAFLGRLNTLKTFMEDGGDVNCKLANGNTLIIAAVLGGQLEIIDYLLKKGANIDERGYEGKTALHCAVDRASLDIVQVLVKAGAKLNITDQRGYTARSTASNLGRNEVYKFLSQQSPSGNEITRNTFNRRQY